MPKAFPKDRRGRPAKYPWRAMKIGDVKFYQMDGHSSLESLRCSLISTAHQTGTMRLETRVDTARNGVYVKRVS